MTSYMTIMVRVVSNRAQAQLAALRAQQAGLTSGIAAAGRQEPLGRRHITSLMKFGNQLQWTGRMLQYNFTLPILAAGAAATHFALEQEKAFIHVTKVYGDVDAAAAQFRKEMGLGQAAARKLAQSYQMEELKALDDAFTAISQHYGVQKKEVNEVAGAWAAAGASGRDLAESVNQTMQAMIIGDMDSATATKALISIQAQYNLSTKELQATLANLNSVENQTGASMSDLIIGFEKAAGVARSAGVETQQLAAYMAALVPATGSASTAGNALKTVISRLMSPTKEAKQVMEAMGLEVTAMSWQSMTATERLKQMAIEYQGLGKSAQNAAASVIASRWQVNRFEVLMRELVSTTGYYAKALQSAEDQGQSFRRMQKELNTVLESDPRRLTRMWVMLQNASVNIIQPLIPHIIYLADRIAALATAFANMEPHTQKLVLIMLLLLAAVGPFVRYMGALITLLGVVGHAFVMLAAWAWRLVKVLWLISGPVKMLGTVVMGTLGLISSALTAALSGMIAVMSGAFGIMVSITTRAWAIQVGIWRTALLIQSGLFTVFVTKFRMAMILAMTTGSSTWGAFWAAMKLMTVTGLATQFILFRKAMGIVAIIRLMGSAIVLAWSRTWAMVGAINGAGWVLLKAQWVVGSLTGIGIWSKFRTAFVTIHMTIAAAVSTIWRGLALSMLVASRAAISGVTGMFSKLAVFFLRFGKFLVSPWGIAFLAVMGLFYAFRDQIQQVWSNIVGYFSNQSGAIAQMFGSLGNAILSVFYKLPAGVQRAMVAVVTVIRDAALAIYDWFSYINPFARHSPSLVDNVNKGMDAVLKKFSTLSQIKKYTTAAYAEIKRFGDLTAKLGMSAQAQENKTNRKTLKKAGAGDALASYDKLLKMMNRLQPVLKALEGKISAQERVVDRWQKKLDEANKKLEIQQGKLDKLQAKLDKYQQKLQDAQSSLEYFANAPLVGMRDMEDQIFANTMAQTKLKLAMMDMEDVVGTYDDIQQKMEAINGLQEILRGTQQDLRSAGAGSDILNQYDSEIGKLEDQKVVYTEATQKMNDMQVELAKLQREAEKLDLVKAMKFDELEYAIARAADQTKELTFDEVMSGIAGANEQIAKYGPLVDEATKAVAEQQKVVDEATAARDRMADRLDTETAKLDILKGKYDEVRDAISGIESAINDVVSAAEKMNDAMAKKADAKKKSAGAAGADYISPGLQNFLDAGNAGFEDPGGKGIPPRADWSSQADDIKKFTEGLGADTASMFAELNPFAPLKDKALKVWDWVKNKTSDVASSVGNFFSAAFDKVDMPFSSSDIKGKLEKALEIVTSVANEIAKPFKWAYELLWPQVKKIGEGVWNGLKALWEKVGPKLAEFKDLWKPLGDALANAWGIMKPILAVIIGVFLLVGTTLLAMVGEAIGPAIEAIGTILGGLVDLVRGIVQVIIGIFTGDLSMILDGVGAIFEGLWGVISGIFGGGIRVVWNLIQGFVFGIRDFFLWLWDALVGHSIVPDTIDGIFSAFDRLKKLAKWVWDNVIKPVVDFFKSMWTDYLQPFLSGIWDKVKTAWDNLKKLGQWVWDNVLLPVKNFFVSLWTDHVKPTLSTWWENIKNNWAALKALGQWVWDNVLLPVKNFFTGLWPDHVKPKLAEWWENIKSTWTKLTELGGWVTKNVMDPVKNAFTSGWQAIKQWFLDNSDILTKPVGTVVNTVLGAVNSMINGLNKVSDVLPGVEWHIEPITKLAAGGPIPERSGSRGFMTNGARAIVGEGKANHPEFVIPTDPTHRRRAVSLLTMAASKIGMGPGVASKGVAGDTAKDIANVMRNNGTLGADGTPQFGIGGWLSDQWGDLKGIAEDVAKLPRNAVGAVMNPLLDAGQKKIKGINFPPVEAPPLYGINVLRDWVNGTDNVVNSSQVKADDMVTGGPKVRSALAWAKTQVGKPYTWGGVGPDGYDCSGFMSAITNHLTGNPLHSRVGATASFPWGGFTFGLTDKGFNIGSTANYGGSGIGHMAGTLGGVNVESAGGVGVRVGSSARGANDLGFNTRAHLAMKQGGIALARRGQPTPITVGDGRYDEAVVPLPYGWQNLRGGQDGGRTINVNGDLSFPNITDPGDIDLFIQNLENLARD